LNDRNEENKTGGIRAQDQHWVVCKQIG
jgi:hypothetical protein